MRLRFDANQEHQLVAVAAVADLFREQPHVGTTLEFAPDSGLAAVRNRLDLPAEAILRNLREVQEAAGLPVDEALATITQSVDMAGGPEDVTFPNFTVEMETGTGKTYVYLRTALELARRYGMRKFIVVAPTVAVREGVLKTLEITREHFREHFDNLPYRFYAYDSANITQIRQFSLSDSVEIMVMTIDSFNKASNVIRQNTDRLPGVESPIRLLQQVHPILILDEPQRLESEGRVAALASLRPLFALRYSATHRNPYNVVHRLSPFDAYRQGLVKRIEVAGAEEGVNANRVFVRVDEVATKKNRVSAKLTVHRRVADGGVREAAVTVTGGDSLEGKTDRSEYAAWVVEEIRPWDQSVLFANGVEMRVGEQRGGDRLALFREQIRYTVEEHFRRQAKLDAAGHDVKALSLFFIDRVANYLQEDGSPGIIRAIFEEVYEELRARRHPDGALLYPRWSETQADRVQGYYFAQRRTRAGGVILEDTKTGEADRDREVYDLILKGKERLLSFDEPTAFIFSHTALSEGWDNPNIFQICTLRQTASEMRKRQEIGRGVRLAVDQDGERVRDDAVNVLTVVANDSYERYVAAYQAEVEEEFEKGAAPPVRNARAPRGTARLRKEHVLHPEFQALWERIRQKTRYAVQVDTEQLISRVVEEMDRAEIQAPEVVIQKARVAIAARADVFAAQLIGEKHRPIDQSGLPLPNLLDLVGELMEHITPPTRISRRTVLEIIRRTRARRFAVANAQEFAALLVRAVRRELAGQLVAGIRYEPIDEVYELSQFAEEISTLERYLIPVEKSVYTHVVVDTLAQDPRTSVEGLFAAGLEAWDEVKVYVKLPAWFVVPTPIGNYNPDWAVVIEPRDAHGERSGAETLYFVAETKDPDWERKLPRDGKEWRKIQCGAAHFGSVQFRSEGALDGVSYCVAGTVEQLREEVRREEGQAAASLAEAGDRAGAEPPEAGLFSLGEQAGEQADGVVGDG